MELPVGMRGYYAAQQMDRQNQAADLQRAGTLSALYENMRQMGERQAVRDAVVMGPDGQLNAPATIANMYRVNPTLGVQFQTALQKEQETFGTDPKFSEDPVTKQPYGYVVGNRGTVRRLEGVAPRDKIVATPTGNSTMLRTEYSTEPIATLPHTQAPTEFERELRAAGIEPGTPAWEQAFKGRVTKQSTHPAPVKVAVSTERGYGSNFAGKIAEADVLLRDTALKAPDLATRANDVLSILNSGKVITGAGADYRLMLGKALNLAGATDSETIANTESLATSLARNTLDAIKASGLGAGNGFSNADRDFLQQAVGGKINLEKNTIERLARLSYKAAQGSVQKWQERARTIPRSALEGTGVGSEQINLPPQVSPQRVSSLPDPATHRGYEATDATTGITYISDGVKWNRKR